MEHIVLQKQDCIDIVNTIFTNDWDEKDIITCGNYTVSHFKGTAFASDYQCYKIESEKQHNPSEKESQKFVAKIATVSEIEILKLLKARGFPVPNLYYTLKSNKNKILLIEEFMRGEELYGFKEEEPWLRTIKELAKIHCNFINLNDTELKQIEEIADTFAYNKKLGKVVDVVKTQKSWEGFAIFAFKRMKNAKKTLVHGDMFPTNIIVDRENVSFIDWANSCIFAYSMDIGRITSIIDSTMFKPMCPCPQKVIEEYYNEIKDALEINYEDYLKDVHAAQFIELIWHYHPSAANIYSNTVKQKIDEIVSLYF